MPCTGATVPTKQARGAQLPPAQPKPAEQLAQLTDAPAFVVVAVSYVPGSQMGGGTVQRGESGGTGNEGGDGGPWGVNQGGARGVPAGG